jgi:hypothetical protein
MSDEERIEKTVELLELMGGCATVFDELGEAMVTTDSPAVEGWMSRAHSHTYTTFNLNVTVRISSSDLDRFPRIITP